jgi:hypothetical protein
MGIGHFLAAHAAGGRFVFLPGRLDSAQRSCQQAQHQQYTHDPAFHRHDIVPRDFLERLESTRAYSGHCPCCVT